MKFKKKAYTEEIIGILSKYLDGTEKEFREATDRILTLLQLEHAEKLVLKAQLRNALIAADKTEIWHV